MRAAVLAITITLIGSGGATPAHRLSHDPSGQDTVAEARHRLAQTVLDRLGDRAALPADSVWNDLHVLGGLKAGQLVRVMDEGFGRSLGVGCSYCHVPGRFSRDDSTQKQVAREMWKMMGLINGELLKAIPNLRSEHPTVNCTTCHRGQIKPLTNLDSASVR